MIITCKASKAGIPGETPIRTEKVAKNDFGSGGGTQYTIPKSQVRELPEDWFVKDAGLTADLLD